MTIDRYGMVAARDADKDSSTHLFACLRYPREQSRPAILLTIEY